MFVEVLLQESLIGKQFLADSANVGGVFKGVLALEVVAELGLISKECSTGGTG